MNPRGTIYISYKIYSDLCNSIAGEICKVFFHFALPFQTTKIYQQIKLNVIGLIGRHKTEEEIVLIKKKIIEEYISHPANRGAAVGVDAAAFAAAPIVQQKLKSQHSSGKKSSTSSTSLLDLNRLKVGVKNIRIHITDEFLPKQLKSTILFEIPNFLKKLEDELNEMKHIVTTKIIEKYHLVMTRRIDLENHLETLQTNAYFNNAEIEKTKQELKTLLAPGKDNLSLFSESDMHEKILTFEKNFHMCKHALENLVLSDDNDLSDIALLLPTIFRLEFKKWFYSSAHDSQHKYLSYNYEEVKVGDVLTAFFGSCKYTSFQTDEEYDQNPFYIYTNYRPIPVNSEGYKFKFDVDRLNDAGISHLDIFNILAEIRDFTIVMHPITENRFDILIGNNPFVKFAEIIKTFLSRSIKGINGLQFIDKKIINVSDFAKTTVYDESTNLSHIFIKANGILHFPKEELYKRIRTPEYTKAKLVKDNINLKDPNEIFSLVYEGPIVIDPVPYIYYTFCGTMTAKHLLNKIGNIFSAKYFTTNDPLDMISICGKIGTRSNHEAYYSEELNATGMPLLYQNISIICRNIFAYNLTPITPGGFFKSCGVNAIDALCFQNHDKNLESAIVKSETSSTEGLTSSIFFGRPPNLGTNYIRLKLNKAAYKKVMDMYVEARRQKRYFGKYQNVELLEIGEMKALTILSSVDRELPNNFRGF